MIYLRSYTPFPPGEFLYEQKYPGGVMLFKGDGLSMEQQAKRVVDFRKGNQLDRATLSQTIEDISIFTCTRLGGMTKWCVDSDAPVVAFVGNSGGGCSTCGRPVNA